MTVTSGRQCAMLSKTSGPLGLLVRTCLSSLVWADSTPWLLRWKTSVTPSNRLLFQLVRWETGNSVKEYGLLPTAKAGDANLRGNYNLNERRNGLPAAIKRLMILFPVAAAQDAGNSTLPPSQKLKRKGAHGTIPSMLLNCGSHAGTPISPRFYEWLMGYPLDWTAGKEIRESKPSATPSSRKSSSRSSTGSRKSKGEK